MSISYQQTKDGSFFHTHSVVWSNKASSGDVNERVIALASHNSVATYCVGVWTTVTQSNKAGALQQNKQPYFPTQY